MAVLETRSAPTALLRELHIRNFAVIEEVRLDFDSGLTVLSGETGAGKSIIVGALSLLLGERASSDLVRQGESRALIEGCFDISARPDLLKRLEEAGLESEDGWLILRRELQKEGRNRAWVNGSPATAGLIRDLGSALVDLHGQHEHQALLRGSAQRRILDAYGEAGHIADRVAETHARLAELHTRIAEVMDRAARAREREDYLQYKAAEIENARLQPGEDEQLKSEARRLEHSEELMGLATRLYEATYGGEDAVVDRLGEVQRWLNELTRIDPDTEVLTELQLTAQHALEELGRRLGQYRETVEHDPARLEDIRVRLDLLYRLKQKYGPALEDVIGSGHAAREELRDMESSDLEVARLKKEAASVGERLVEEAGQLTAARNAAARKLEKAMDRLLPDLGMAGGQFRVALETRDDISARGAERIEFRASLNPGFEPGPLARVASGGEMSRLMLALKSALVVVDEVPCLVFDEIDAGVGGAVAQRVAAHLARVSEGHQVFVVTHLAQIAAHAGAHLSVYKREVDGRTSTSVHSLAGPERVEELARMLGGDPQSHASRRHAEELLAATGP